MSDIDFGRRTNDEINELYSEALMRVDKLQEGGGMVGPQLSYMDGILAVLHWMGKPFMSRRPFRLEEEDELNST